MYTVKVRETYYGLVHRRLRLWSLVLYALLILVLFLACWSFPSLDFIGFAAGAIVQTLLVLLLVLVLDYLHTVGEWEDDWKALRRALWSKFLTRNMPQEELDRLGPTVEKMISKDYLTHYPRLMDKAKKRSAEFL